MTIDPAWYALMRRIARGTMTRRAFLPGAAAFAGGLALPGRIKAYGLPDQATWPSTNRIKHVVILVQENRSFDHYFGAFTNQLGLSGPRATGFTPDDVTYRDASGQAFHPFHSTEIGRASCRE